MAILGADKLGNSPYPVISFTGSTTWTCPVAMEVIIYVIGAGGAGGVASNGAQNELTGSDDNAYALGGGAGGCAVSKLTLAAQDYTVVIGAGGGSVYNTGNTSNAVFTAGTAGGASSFAGTGITTMNALGGAGGACAAGNMPSSNTAGGAANGGTIMNNAGGGALRSSATGRHISGGGAVGLWAAGENGALSTTGGGTASGGICSVGDSTALSQANYGLTSTSISPFTGLLTSLVRGGLVSATGGTPAGEGLPALSANTVGIANAYGNTHWYYQANSALNGGGAFANGNRRYMHGGSASCGGGSGGCIGFYQSGGNTPRTYNGSGGSGMVIIFPLDM